MKKEGLSPETAVFKLDNQEFPMSVYNIGQAFISDYTCPGLMNTGTSAEVLALYKKAPALVNNHFPGYTTIPYCLLAENEGRVYGDYTSQAGQEEFLAIESLVNRVPFDPPNWSKDLWSLARLKQPRVFDKDETLSALYELHVNSRWGLTLAVGPRKYSESFYTMGSEGVKISLSPAEEDELLLKMAYQDICALKILVEKLVKSYGAGTSIREAILRHYKRSTTKQHIVPFNDGVFSYAIGVAGLVLTTDREFIFVLRGKNVSINRGINVTASGGIVFNTASELLLRKHGFPCYVSDGMHTEISEELGLDRHDYALVPIGFCRELPRGGSPEMMFLIDYRGSTQSFMETVSRNQHPGRQEIERYLYAQSIEEAERLVRTPGGDQIVQHKGVLSIILALEYLVKQGRYQFKYFS